MSIITQAFIAEKYGIRLDAEALASILGIATGTILNNIRSGRFTIPTYKDGGKVWADYRDVAEYIDACRKQGKKAVYASENNIKHQRPLRITLPSLDFTDTATDDHLGESQKGDSDLLTVAIYAVRHYAETHPRPSHVTQAQIADMLGISMATVARMVKIGHFKPNAMGLVPIVEVDRALAEPSRESTAKDPQAPADSHS